MAVHDTTLEECLYIVYMCQTTLIEIYLLYHAVFVCNHHHHSGGACVCPAALPRDTCGRHLKVASSRIHHVIHFIIQHKYIIMKKIILSPKNIQQMIVKHIHKRQNHWDMTKNLVIPVTCAPVAGDSVSVTKKYWPGRLHIGVSRMW